jgi:hypothetical protein
MSGQGFVLPEELDHFRFRDGQDGMLLDTVTGHGLSFVYGLGFLPVERDGSSSVFNFTKE